MATRALMVFQEFSFYSPLLDSEAVRLSVCDAHAREFFMIIKQEDGKAWREKREKALGYIMEAIDMGCDPGQVRVRL